jgi:hypothetical protein
MVLLLPIVNFHLSHFWKYHFLHIVPIIIIFCQIPFLMLPCLYINYHHFGKCLKQQEALVVRLLVAMSIKQTTTITIIVAPQKIVRALKCIGPFCMVLKAMWWFDRVFF